MNLENQPIETRQASPTQPNSPPPRPPAHRPRAYTVRSVEKSNPPPRASQPTKGEGRHLAALIEASCLDPRLRTVGKFPRYPTKASARPPYLAVRWGKWSGDRQVAERGVFLNSDSREAPLHPGLRFGAFVNHPETEAGRFGWSAGWRFSPFSPCSAIRRAAFHAATGNRAI